MGILNTQMVKLNVMRHASKIFWPRTLSLFAHLFFSPLARLHTLSRVRKYQISALREQFLWPYYLLRKR